MEKSIFNGHKYRLQNDGQQHLRQNYMHSVLSSKVHLDFHTWKTTHHVLRFNRKFENPQPTELRDSNRISSSDSGAFMGCDTARSMGSHSPIAQCVTESFEFLHTAHNQQSWHKQKMQQQQDHELQVPKYGLCTRSQDAHTSIQLSTSSPGASNGCDTAGNTSELSP